MTEATKHVRTHTRTHTHQLCALQSSDHEKGRERKRAG